MSCDKSHENRRFPWLTTLTMSEPGKPKQIENKANNERRTRWAVWADLVILLRGLEDAVLCDICHCLLKPSSWSYRCFSDILTFWVKIFPYNFWILFLYSLPLTSWLWHREVPLWSYLFRGLIPSCIWMSILFSTFEFVCYHFFAT